MPDQILVFSKESRKQLPTGFCVCSKNNFAPHRSPPWSISIATDPFRALTVYSTSFLSLLAPAAAAPH